MRQEKSSIEMDGSCLCFGLFGSPEIESFRTVYMVNLHTSVDFETETLFRNFIWLIISLY